MFSGGEYGKLGLVKGGNGGNLRSKFGSKGNGSVFSLDSDYLLRLRSEAVRRRVWFRILSRVERAIVNLTIRVVDRPRSLRLIEALARIVVKVRRALMSPIVRLVECVGRPLAKKLSRIAVRWGNKNAEKWAEDRDFMRYLAIIDMNNIPGFRLSNALLAS